MRVVANFIRINALIVDVADISGIWNEWDYSSGRKSSGEVTKIRMKTGDSCHTLDGHLVDEIWELLQLASMDHLDPYDKLREKMVL